MQLFFSQHFLAALLILPERRKRPVAQGLRFRKSDLQPESSSRLFKTKRAIHHYWILAPITYLWRNAGPMGQQDCVALKRSWAEMICLAHRHVCQCFVYLGHRPLLWPLCGEHKFGRWPLRALACTWCLSDAVLQDTPMLQTLVWLEKEMMLELTLDSAANIH